MISASAFQIHVKVEPWFSFLMKTPWQDLRLFLQPSHLYLSLKSTSERIPGEGSFSPSISQFRHYTSMPFQVPPTKSTDHCTNTKIGTTKSSNVFVNVFVFNEKGTKLRGIKGPNDYQSSSCKLEGTQDTCQDKLPNMSGCLSCFLAAEVKLVALQLLKQEGTQGLIQRVA